MTLNIKKVGEDRYLATATPRNVSEDWTTKEALTANQLAEEIFKRGGHQTDIGDALHEANLEWLASGGPSPRGK
jgi:hypothetical protein